MKFFLTSDSTPLPARKRKQVSNALESHEEYLQLKAAVLHGRMRPMQAAVITMGPEDAKALDYKFPWRAAVDSMRRFLRANGFEKDYTVRKYETMTPGVWAVSVTYDPPDLQNAQPRAESSRDASTARTRRRSRAS